MHSWIAPHGYVRIPRFKLCDTSQFGAGHSPYSTEVTDRIREMLKSRKGAGGRLP